jgi:tetratricopeptide (TPR) repeat protein
MRQRGLILLLCAVAAARAGAPDIASLQARLRLLPGDPALLRALGWALLEYRRDAAAAYPPLLRAVAADPGDLNGHKLLALACTRTGRFRCATAEYETVLEQEPADVWMWVNYAGALLAGHDFVRARDAYRHALHLRPGYGPAVQGLRDWESLRAARVSVTEQSFTDSSAFNSSATTLSMRSGFGESVQFMVDVTRRSFTLGVAGLVRNEIGADLGIPVAPAVELHLQTLAVRDGISGERTSGGIAATWSRPGRLVVVSVQARGPIVPDTLQAARRAITADRLAVGFDQSVFRSLTVQGLADYGRWSDGNHRLYGFAQLSQRLPVRSGVNLRLRYERLAFSSRTVTYFSPRLFQVVRPQVDGVWPLSRVLAFEAHAGLVLAPPGNGFGRSLSAGARLRAAHLTLRASGTDDAVPGVSPWSGRGFRIEGALTF